MSLLTGDGTLGVAWLGSVPYAEALDLQERLREARVAGEVGDLLLLLEHPAVYTRGRRATPDELPLGADWYAERGIEIVDVRRGGKVTFHGPGQLVGYLVAGTADVIGVVRALERAMVVLAREDGVDARGRNDEGIEYTGVWVEDRKLGSIGLHLSRGVTTHGVGLNVVTDLTPFSWVVPCGLTAPMTSLARETGAPDLEQDPALDGPAAVRAAGERFAVALGAELGVDVAPADADEVRAAAAARATAAG
ncbi:lipoyl(octanoyl) transferase LipB [Patulibacter minatonensis]|uniref:lipoyl(octanoyl) transferase LipB n=1 Tax=Patulibacter minatonensis TaxID=298163 RepID=UPI0006845870|nr:lipoyl(octanoyl) transferase LipB [Patulibacter minatonensis]